MKLKIGELMKKKSIICLFLITILLISKVNTLTARVNDNKVLKNQPANKDDFSPKNTRGISKGQSKQDSINVSPEPVDPVLPTEPLPEVRLGVYRNPECTILADNIDWGEIEVGGSKNVIIYIKNIGDKEVIASLVTENWYPENLMDN